MEAYFNWCCVFMRIVVIIFRVVLFLVVRLRVRLGVRIIVMKSFSVVMVMVVMSTIVSKVAF